MERIQYKKQYESEKKMNEELKLKLTEALEDRDKIGLLFEESTIERCDLEENIKLLSSNLEIKGKENKYLSGLLSIYLSKENE